ncbi:protein kinase [Polymorphospora sp. NPDC050346]|uniref:serine/threonine-protein kinase n=1 Tax=Polymorphospora sp. NPDC050346 TaxID=3155780 RepID=UPI0033E0BD67
MSAVPSQLIADRYRLVEPLGQGGMGRVWRARDEVLHRDVAIKELVPPPGLTEDERREMRERSLREARAIARLNHINVVRVFDVLRTDADPWIVMEYVPSRSLQDVLASDGPVTPARAVEIGIGVLGALRSAHRSGVVHRDVKPGNVLLGEDGRVVLTDFGLATVPGDPNVTRTGLVLGSPAYIAPERARDGNNGPEADLWSLGATLYAAIEGASPYARPSAIATLAALATEPPPVSKKAGPLKPVLAGLLRKDPETRINAAEAERLLRRAAGRRPKIGLSLLEGARRPSPLGPREPRPTVVPGQRTPRTGTPVSPAPVSPAPVSPAPVSPAPVSPAAGDDPAVSVPTVPADETAVVEQSQAADRTAVVGQSQAADRTAVVKPAQPESPTAADRTVVVRQTGNLTVGKPADRDARSEPSSAAAVAAGTAAGQDAADTAPADTSEQAGTAKTGPADGTTAAEGKAGTADKTAAEDKAAIEDEAGAEDKAAAPERSTPTTAKSTPEPAAKPARSTPVALPAQRTGTDPGRTAVVSGEPTTVIGAAEAPGRSSPDRKQRIWLGAALAVILVLLVAILVPYLGNDDDERSVAPPTDVPTSAPAETGAAETPSATPEPAPTSVAPPSPTPSPEPTGLGDPVVPEGWRLHRDPTGFSVPVPEGWQVRREATRVRFEEPRFGRLLMIDQTDQPQPDPVADWRSKEGHRRSTTRNYQRVGEIRAVDYWDKAADWEWTYTSNRGNKLHVRNRGFITAPDKAYAIYWSTTEDRWNDDLAMFDVIAAGFRPVRS